VWYYLIVNRIDKKSVLYVVIYLSIFVLMAVYGSRLWPDDVEVVKPEETKHSSRYYESLTEFYEYHNYTEGLTGHPRDDF